MHLQVHRDIQKSFFLTYLTLFEPGAPRTEPFCTAPHRCRSVRCAVRRMYRTGPTVRCVVQQKGPLNRTAPNPGITSRQGAGRVDSEDGLTHFLSGMKPWGGWTARMDSPIS